jgi:hypothetical protein
VVNQQYLQPLPQNQRGAGDRADVAEAHAAASSRIDPHGPSTPAEHEDGLLG